MHPSFQLLLISALDDVLIAGLVLLSGLVTQSRLAPRGNRSGTTDRSLALAAAVRVIVRVHYASAYCRTDAHVSLAAGLTDCYELVLEVADLTDGSSALHADLSYFSGRETHLRVISFLSHQLSAVSSCSAELCALAGLELYVVDDGTYRNVCERKCVSGLDISFRAGVEDIPYGQAVRSDDVSLCTVCVSKQCDVSCSVRIVLDRLYCCGDVVLVALEVYDSVLSAFCAALVTNGDLTAVVPSGVLLERSGKGLFRGGLGSDPG